MEKILKSLIVEDSEDDAFILLHFLKKGGYTVFSERVETQESLIDLLSTNQWDVVFSDFTMPKFNGMQALSIVRERDEDIPFIFVSGTIGEERAVNAMKQGATDYIIKGNLTRLIPAVDRALYEVRIKKENQAAKKALEESQERFYHAFYYSGVSMAILTETGSFVEVNQTMCNFLGYSSDEFFTIKLGTIIDDNYHSAIDNFFSSLILNQNNSMHIELQLKHKNSRRLWAMLNASLVKTTSEKKYQYFIIQFYDKTEEKFFEEQILYFKTHHLLTGLLNRETITNYISNLIKNNKNDNFSIILIDLDRFKLINENYGTAIGDSLLRIVSDKFKSHLQAECIGYLGGNEFVFIIKNTSEKACAHFVYSIRRLLLTPILIKQEEFSLTASVGISQYPKHARTALELLKLSYIAMRNTKSKGGNNFDYFNPTIGNFVNKFKIENDLRKAISGNEIDVYYQPKLDSQNKKLSGMEALIRWKKNGVMIPPDEFIPIAEETDLIHELGKIVLKKSIHLYSTLQKNLMISANVKIAVNVSPKQFLNSGFLPYVKDIIEKYNIMATSLELELTESSLMQNQIEYTNVLASLKELGIQVAIDDFGTGYSSLAYLKELKPNRLKIDKSFVNNVSSDPNCQSIIASIISLAHQLGIQVTAEGVETEDQSKFLLEQQCNEFQGYLFSKPLSENQLLVYLQGMHNE